MKPKFGAMWVLVGSLLTAMSWVGSSLLPTRVALRKVMRGGEVGTVIWVT